MRKLFIITLVFVLGVSMSFTNKNTSIINNEIVEKSSNCVRVYVKWPSGNKSTNGRVSAEVCSGGMTKTFYLNDDGYADICYVSDSSLCTIFINGKGYKGHYRKGHTYTIYRER